MITNRDCLVILTIILRKKMEKMENINYLPKNLKIELKKKLLKYLKNVFFLKPSVQSDNHFGHRLRGSPQACPHVTHETIIKTL